MFKGMWIAVLTYFGLIAIAAPPVNIDDVINWVPVADTTIESDEQRDAREWFEFRLDAEVDYLNEFDAIFAAVEFKVSKNGRSMVKGIHSKSFKFAAK